MNEVVQTWPSKLYIYEVCDTIIKFLSPNLWTADFRMDLWVFVTISALFIKSVVSPVDWIRGSRELKTFCFHHNQFLFVDQNSSSGGQGSMSVSVPNLTSSRQEPMSLLESFANLASRNFGCNNKTANTTASNLLRALSCNRATTGECLLFCWFRWFKVIWL